jgi:hypothetical protein
VPDIHVDAHGVAFHVRVVGIYPNATLVIRCDDRGGISAAIAAEPPRRPRS